MSSYREYLTHSWLHVVPTRRRFLNLERIANLLRQFDVVGLQEADGGGARSHHITQTQFLAERSGFRHWYHQINRRFGKISLHTNGLVSRFKADAVVDYKLPGMPGRGALLASYGVDEPSSLYICVVHLALTRRTRALQFAFLAEVLRDLPYAVLMGDFNCEPDAPEMRRLFATTSLLPSAERLKTFPSWRPGRMLDQILVTEALSASRLRVVDFACSDHLPIALDVEIPANLSFKR